MLEIQKHNKNTKIIFDQLKESVHQISKTIFREKVNYGSSRLQMFFKIGDFKNFANFTGKYLFWSFFLITLQALKPAASLKGDSNTGVFL